MTAQNRSYFTFLINKAPDPTGLCIALLLAWVAHADGAVSEQDKELLSSSVTSLVPGLDDLRKQVVIEEVIAIASGGKERELVLACQKIRERISPEQKEVFLDLLIGVIISDNRINLTERFMLEFIADVIDIMPEQVNAAYRDMTGRNLPPLGDPSSRIWWDVKVPPGEQDERAYDEPEYQPGESEEVHRALSTLGLQWGATQEEIHKAYRRMAMKHHPDRFSSLGEQAVKRATRTFVKIKNAYELLKDR